MSPNPWYWQNFKIESGEFVACGPFNDKAAKLAKEYSFDEVIAFAKRHRQQIKRVEWTRPFNIGEHFLTLEEYISDFVWHDSHHKEQIESIR